MRLFGLPAGPSTVRLQELRARDDFAAKFRKRLAQAMVIELDADEEASWSNLYYPELLQILLEEKITSLTLAKGRFDYSYKADDPLHDGIMGWIPASREKCVGPELAECIGKTGLPQTLTALSFRDAGVNAIATTQLLPSLPRGLEKLDLTDNDITQEGVAALGAAELPSLTELRFGWSAFSDAHASALVDAVGAKGGSSKLQSLARLEIKTGALAELSRKRLHDRFGGALHLAG